MSKPQRKNIRAQWDNYQNGTYFITICTHEKQHYFGYIANNEMHLNVLGLKLQQIIFDTLALRKDQFVEIPIFTIMPNHLHFLLVLNTDIDFSQHCFKSNKRNLSSIIRGIKSSLTSFAIKQQIPFEWQRGYYDRIVRDEYEFSNVYDYIGNNVINWQQDEFY
ncbi:hypothetical protein A1D22_04675 [Pasteurellaceae bacterium LFhippo2]|nr:hypothetical protein [Pasteurellaceae bacterium LFhippo2]